MEEQSKKTGFKKNFWTICLLAFSGSIIYGLPYFKNYFYVAYVETYKLTNVQMGALGSAYGFLGLVSYIAGGILADKFKAKKLLIMSLFATGLGGFTHLFFTNFKALCVIYALWGFTSLLLFWPALMKLVRMQANDDEQSKAYGLFEGARGVTNIAHMSIVTALFGMFQAKALPALGLRWIIIFYSVCPILCAILFIFVLKEPQEDPNEKAQASFGFKDFVRALKLPAVWHVVILIFCSYTFNMSIYYFNPYATNIIGASVVFGSIITVLSQYCRPVASAGGGYLANKISNGKMMLAGFVVMTAGTAVMIFIPGMPASVRTMVVIGACVFIYTAMFSNFGLYFALLSEGGIPIDIAGVSIGIACTLGYLPEVICPLIAGRILDVFQGYKGYFIYFVGMLIVGVIGAIFSVLWIKKYEKSSSKNKKVENNKIKEVEVNEAL